MRSLGICRRVRLRKRERRTSWRRVFLRFRSATKGQASCTTRERLTYSLKKKFTAEEAKIEEEALARAPSLALAKEIAEKRKWRVGAPQLSVGADRNRPWVEEGESGAAVVHWPLVFVYPQSGATDAVEVASELDPMSAHLDAMFGESSPSPNSSSIIPPLPWDEEGAYRSRSDIELYYLSHATEPLPDVEALADVLHKGWPEGLLKAAPPKRHGPKAAKAVKVDERWTLGEVLSKGDFVVPGIPAFFVLSRSRKGRAAEVRRRFLEENG